MRRLIVSFVILALTLVFAAPTFAQNTELTDRIRDMAHVASEGAEAAREGQAVRMRSEYEELHMLWERIEDTVREKDAHGYAEIEGALAAIDKALNSKPLDQAAVADAYEHFEHEATEVLERLGGAAPAASAPAGDLAGALNYLDKSYQAIERGDATVARHELEEFALVWPSIEGAVAASSQDAYMEVEANLGRGLAAMRATPAPLLESCAS